MCWGLMLTCLQSKAVNYLRDGHLAVPPPMEDNPLPQSILGNSLFLTLIPSRCLLTRVGCVRLVCTCDREAGLKALLLSMLDAIPEADVTKCDSCLDWKRSAL